MAKKMHRMNYLRHWAERGRASVCDELRSAWDEQRVAWDEPQMRSQMRMGIKT
jgi:hypothetical protein